MEQPPPQSKPVFVGQAFSRSRPSQLYISPLSNHLTQTPPSSLISACDHHDRSERSTQRSLHFFYKRKLYGIRTTTQHGLTSTTLVVLPEEHKHEYEEVLRGFRESFQPRDAIEEALVLRLAQAHWRTLRSRRVETGILNITAGTERALARKHVEDCPEHLSPHNAIAVGFMKNPEERWRTYLRYDGAISRDFFRTLDALTRLQRARQPKSLDAKPLVATAGSAAPLSDSGIRSVSQNSPRPIRTTTVRECLREG